MELTCSVGSSDENELFTVPPGPDMVLRIRKNRGTLACATQLVTVVALLRRQTIQGHQIQWLNDAIMRPKRCLRR